MWRRLAHEGCHLDGGLSILIDVAVARGQSGFVQVEDLSILSEMPLVERRFAEPRGTPACGARIEIHLRPAWDRGRARRIARGVIHESYEICRRRFGTLWRAERGEVSIGEIRRKVLRQILKTGAQAEARIGLPMSDGSDSPE